MKQVVTVMLTAIAVFVHAQTNPFIQAQKCFGGTKSDEARSIRQTKDGGYIIAGLASSNNGNVSGNHGGYDAWIVKLRPSGSIEWQKSLGGTVSDYAASIEQTKEGGYIFAGFSYSNDGDVSGHHGATESADCWIVKLSASGSIEWQKSLGGAQYDEATSIQQTREGGYIIAGSSTSNDGDVSGNHGGLDYWLVKLDTSGNIQWQKSLGGSKQYLAYSVDQTKDDGYIVAGYSQSNDGDVSGHHGTTKYADYWIVKLSASGSIEWQKSLGGAKYDEATSIQQVKEGGYIIAGSSTSNDGDVSGNHGGLDYWLVRLSAAGNIQWQKSLGGTNNDAAYSVDQTKDSGCIVAGYSYSNDGDVSGHHGVLFGDYWIAKIDAAGNIQWQTSLGGTNQEWAHFIIQKFDGSYVVAGSAASDDGDVTGLHGLVGNSDYWIVQLSSSGNFVSQLPSTAAAAANSSFNTKNLSFSITVSPNPAHSVLHISGLVPGINYELKIMNESGNAVMSKSIKNISSYDMDVSRLAAGVYYLQAGSNTFRFIKE